jgi:hypothetical protein
MFTFLQKQTLHFCTIPLQLFPICMLVLTIRLHRFPARMLDLTNGISSFPGIMLHFPL